jgi:hypothetical protein
MALKNLKKQTNGIFILTNFVPHKLLRSIKIWDERRDFCGCSCLRFCTNVKEKCIEKKEIMSVCEKGLKNAREFLLLFLLVD